MTPSFANKLRDLAACRACLSKTKALSNSGPVYFKFALQNSMRCDSCLETIVLFAKISREHNPSRDYERNGYSEV